MIPLADVYKAGAPQEVLRISIRQEAAGKSQLNRLQWALNLPHHSPA
jgi:hypothetical protein